MSHESREAVEGAAHGAQLPKAKLQQLQAALGAGEQGEGAPKTQPGSSSYAEGLPRTRGVQSLACKERACD